MILGGENMEKLLGPLTGMDFLFAAAAAYIITQIILRFRRIRQFLSEDKELSMNIKGIDITAVLSRCKSMFPIDTVIFEGKTYQTGMKVRITTSKNKVIEGQFIGKNNMDVICIITKQYIIAHEIGKIEHMAMIEKE